MVYRAVLGFLMGVVLTAAAQAPPQPPVAGKVEFLESAQIQPGMKGYAWTVFEGADPEPVPVEILGLLKNALGPRQDLILAKLGGRAAQTNVAGGMSGSPVYIGGKLAGAISRRVSVFSPDAICGITPIEQMLEVAAMEERQSLRASARGSAPYLPAPSPSELLATVAGALPAGWTPENLGTLLVPIESPLVFSGFHESVLRDVAPLFRQLGMTVVQGGGGGGSADPTPVPGWEKALRPGQGVAGLLVAGDMTVAVQGTVTYNDGRHVLAFGHSFLNLGPVEMPMGRSEVVMTLSSSYQPNKFANVREVVGVVRQDRSGGVLGILGEKAEMIPLAVTVRALKEDGTVRSEKRFRYSVFVQERYTPNLIMTTLYNTISGLNEFSEQATYRLSGKVGLAGGRSLSLTTMQAPTSSGAAAPLLVASYVGDRFNRLFLNAVAPPRFTGAEVTVDLLPEARITTIENAWAAVTEARAGETIPVKVFLRPFRGGRIERDLQVQLPAGLPPGQHRILFSDADTLNRLQGTAGRMNRFIGLDETIALINQERSNNQLYVSLLQSAPAVYYDDKTMPNLPASALNLMQSGPMASRPFVASRETVIEQAAVPFDTVVSGSYSLTIAVK